MVNGTNVFTHTLARTKLCEGIHPTSHSVFVKQFRI